MKSKYFIIILLAAIGIITYGYATQQNTSHHSTSTKPVHATPAKMVIVRSVPDGDTTHKRNSLTAPIPSPVADSISVAARVDTANTDMPDDENYDPTSGMSSEEKSIYTIMDTSALAMFIRHDPKNASLDMMSRCPSGYQYYMTDTSATNNIRMGMIELYKGCDGHKVCEFKVNFLTGVVLLKDKKSKEFVTVSEYERKRWGKAS